MFIETRVANWVARRSIEPYGLPPMLLIFFLGGGARGIISIPGKRNDFGLSLKSIITTL